MPSLRIACPAILALTLAGCMVGPDYKRTKTALPPHFKELPGWKLATPSDALPKGAWWQLYNDPLLNSLESKVAVSNLTLAADAAAYDQARALTDEARAALFPTLSLTPQVTRAKSGGNANTATPNTISSYNQARTDFSLEASASYTVDVWGTIRRQIESSKDSAQASAATLANATLSAQAALATAYLDLRVTDALQRVLNSTVAADQRALQIAQNQYEAGFVARSDVLTAQATLDAAQAAALNVGVARAQYEHAIAVQIGMPPANLTITPINSVPAVPEIPGALPSDLLERRPDIAAAERSMAAENALIGVAIGAYYPTVSLSALFGYAGNPIGALFNASNQLWSLGAAAGETVFNGGEHGAAVRAARAAYNQAVANYKLTVITALQGVEDNLAALRILAQQDKVDQQSVADAQYALDITLNEYRAGTVAYTAVVSAQTTLLSAQQTQISVQMQRLADSVALIIALGGGWQPAH